MGAESVTGGACYDSLPMQAIEERRGILQLAKSASLRMTTLTEEGSFGWQKTPASG
jgi:hypothetical protein